MEIETYNQQLPPDPALGLHGVMPRFSSVLSLFDGLSCGQIALNRVGIEYDNYFASEIDKHAIKVTQTNYPKTIQLGDVKNVNVDNLPTIDLMFGGSTCTDFSFAGRARGMVTTDKIEITDLETYLRLKEEGFEFVGQSYLFWEYVRILKEVKPKYFLLENVKMSERWKKVISDTLGVEPIKIDSRLVSAQKRQRLYWTNIPNVEQPENKNIYLIDILDKDVDEKLFLKPEVYNRFTLNRNFILNKEKSVVIGKLSNHQGDRVFNNLCKGSSLSASGGNNGGGGCNIIFHPTEFNNRLRRLSINECERLQTVPDNYTECVPVTSRYKMLGNGWTVDVIVHIFGSLLNGA